MRRYIPLMATSMAVVLFLLLVGAVEARYIQPPTRPHKTAIPTRTPTRTPSPTPTFTPTPTPTPGGLAHLYGLVGQGQNYEPVDAARLAQAANGGVTLRMLELNWANLQPTGSSDWAAGAYSDSRSRLAAFLAASPATRIILDLGMQYPPAWVAGIDPLVDQFGTVRQASPSNGGGVNVYFSPTVRQYAAAYIQRVFQSFDFQGRLWVVRIGPYGGEMMFPEARTRDGGQSFWAYDRLAQAQSPVPGWRPGQPSPNGEARTFYDWYVGRVADTFTYLAGQVRLYFSGYIAPVTAGLGVTDWVVNNLVGWNLLDTVMCCYGTGNYWSRIFPEFAPRDPAILAWCSSFGDTSGTDDTTNDPRTWSSAHLMASYAQAAGRPIFGENPGHNYYDGTPYNATMRWIMDQVTRFRYIGLVWIRESDMTQGYATLDQYLYEISNHP